MRDTLSVTIPEPAAADERRIWRRYETRKPRPGVSPAGNRRRLDGFDYAGARHPSGRQVLARFSGWAVDTRGPRHHCVGDVGVLCHRDAGTIPVWPGHGGAAGFETSVSK